MDELEKLIQASKVRRAKMRRQALLEEVQAILAVYAKHQSRIYHEANSATKRKQLEHRKQMR